jgi:very-short-patch-repair endonuclease
MLAAMAREFHEKPRRAAKRESHAPDAAIARIAARQEGSIGREQLIRVGLTRHEIGGRIRAGRLHPIHRGVYAVGHSRLGRNGRYHAALLFAGEGAVLSHRSAADLWELRASKETAVDVIVPTHRRGDAVVRMRQDDLDPRETMTRDGIRVTKPLRTLLDLAACVTDKELERAIRQAIYRKLTTTTLLADAVRKRSGQRGMARMRKALARIGEAPGVTRSPLEEEFLPFLRRHRLPMPELNVEIAGYEVDCVWREQRLIVELDGRDAHDQSPAFESDRARDAALLAAGWRVMRVTSWRIRHDGKRLASQLRAILR